MNKLLRKAARAVGYDLAPRSREKARQLPPDISDADRAVLERIAPYTMTSIDRQISLIQAVRHIAHRNPAWTETFSCTASTTPDACRLKNELPGARGLTPTANPLSLAPLYQPPDRHDRAAPGTGPAVPASWARR
ncbi:MAG: hypothetical protein WC058_03285 [Phycisphaeraceae bacterium]